MGKLTKEQKCILYIDDEQENLDGFLYTFRKDYTIYLSKDISTARDIIDNHDIQVLISDQRMPEKSGTEFLSEIAQTHPNIIRIIITAYADMESVIDAINKGRVYSYLTKPWNRDEIKNALDNAFEAYYLRHENVALVEELKETNSALKSANKKLLDEIEIRKSTEEKLQEYRNQLEILVKERTDELQLVNEELKATNEELFEKNTNLITLTEKLKAEIEERKTVELALKTSETKLLNFIRQSADGISIVDQDGKIIEWNPALENITEISGKEAITKFVWDLESVLLFQETKDTGFSAKLKSDFLKSRSSGTEPVVNTWEHSINTPSGKTKTIQSTSFPIKINQQVLTGTISRDITEKKKTENELDQYRNHLEELVELKTNELKASEQRIKNLSNNLPGGAVLQILTTSSGQDKVIYASTKLEELFEVPIEDVYTNSWNMYGNCLQKDIENLKNLRKKSIETGNVLDCEVRLKTRKDKNQLKYLRIKALPKRQPDQTLLWDALVIDITGPKRAELERKMFFNHSADILVISDFNNPFKQVSPSIESILGYTPEEFVTIKIQDIVHPDDLKATLQTAVDLSRGKTIHNLHNRYRHKNGDYHWLSWNAYPLKEEKKVFSIARDITPLKLAEESLRISRERFKSIVDSSPMGLYMYELNEENELILTMTNHAADEIIGIKHRSLLQKPIEKAFPNLAQTEIPEIYRNIARDGGLWHSEQFNYADKRFNSSYEVHAFQSSQGSVTVLFLDITERLSNQEKIKKSELQFRTLFEQAGEGILVGKQDGTILDTNTTMCHLTGYSREELVNGNISMLFSKDELGTRPLQYKKVLRGEVVTTERRLNRKDGKTIIIQMNSKQLADGRLQALFRDITEEREAQQKLEESEEKYRLIVELQSELVVKVDKEGRYLFVSPSYCRAFGKSEADLLGSSFMPFVHVDDQKPTADAMMKLYKPPYTAYVEQRALTVNGWRWLAWSDRAILNEKNEVIEIIGVGRDITDKKEFEQELVRSNSFLEAINNATPDVIFVLDLESNRFNFFNNRLTELTGYTDKELEKANNVIDLLVFHKDKLICQQHQEKLLKAKGNQIITNEIRLVGKNNQVFWVLIREQIFERDENTSPVKSIGVITDITELKENEQALIDSEKKYRLVFENANDAIFLMKKDKFISCNKKTLEIFNCSYEDIIGKTPFDFSPDTQPNGEKSKTKAVEYIKSSLQGNTHSFEWQHITKSGKPFDAEVVLNSLIFNNEIFIQAIVRDISERKKAERREKEHRDFLMTLLETIPIPVYYKNVNTEFVGCNSAFEASTGFKRGDIHGKTVRDLFPNTDFEKDIQSDLQLIEFGGNRIEEASLQYADGSIRDVIYHKAAYTDAEENIIGLIGAIFDITERKKSEKALKQSERNLKEAQKLAKLSNWWIDIHQNVIHWSDEFFNILGDGTYANPIGLEKFIKKIVYPDDQSLVREKLQLHQVSKDIVKFDYRILTQAGKVLYLENIGRGEFDSKGNLTSIKGTVKDISERKQAEKALKESEERFRNLAESAFEGIVISIDGKILTVNSQIAWMLGYDVDEIIGKNAIEMVAPESQDMVKKAIKEGFKGPYVHLARRKDGTTFPVEVLARNIPYEGKQARVTAIRDISEREKAEKTILENERKFRNIFNNSSDAILISDVQGFCFEANHRLLEYLNCSRKDIIGSSIYSFFDKHQQEEIEKHFSEVEKKGTAPALELDYKKDEHHHRPVEFHSKSINYEDKKAILTIIRDITLRKLTEHKVLDAIIKTEEKERENFAKNLHDDLGPLLSSIRMYMNSFVDTDNPEKQKYIIEQVNEILREAIQTTKQISNDLSPHILTNYGIVSAIDNFIEKLTHHISIDFNTSIADTRFNNMLETTFYRIIKELINNTLKHANASEIKINLEYDGANLYLTYRDNGIGFDFEAVEKKGMGLFNLMSRIKSLNGNFAFKHPEKGILIEIEAPAVPLSEE